jgi:hypothetical protein
MENQELKHYIDAQLAGGTAPEELKKLLMHHGWDGAIVDAHLPPKAVAASPLVEIGTATLPDGPYIDNRSKRKWAIFFLVLPFALLVLIMTVYAVNSFVVNAALSSQSATVAAPPGSAHGLGSAPMLDSAIGLSLPNATGLGQADKRATVASIVNVALCLLGLLALLSLFVCIPIGIVLLVRSRRTLKPGAIYDERSGKGEASIIPPELGHWNWGAAFLSVWWGLYYRVWIAFLVFVPVIGYFWWVVMGIKGNEWAWQKNQWLTVDEFKKAQKKWAVWAIALLVFSVLMGLVCALLMVIGVAKLGPGRFVTVQQTNPAEGLSYYGSRVSGAPLAVEVNNATYVINGQPVTLKNGTSASFSANDPSAGATGLSTLVTTTIDFSQLAFGDLNADGSEDMAFVIWQQTGGSGTFYYLAAALAEPNGAAPATDTVLLGDRIKPVSTEVKNGLIIVTYLDRKPGEPMVVDPSVMVVRRFKIADGKLNEVK